MQILVATVGWLLLVDLTTKKVVPLENNRTEYYGISWFPDGDKLVLTHSGLNNDELETFTHYGQSEKGFLSHGSDFSQKFLSLPHQLICTNNEDIVVTNTGRNALIVFNWSKKTIREVRISGERWDAISADNKPGDHPNSVFISGNVLWVMAHGNSKGSYLLAFSYPELELLSRERFNNCFGLHNIFVTSDGEKISCDSSKSSLVKFGERFPLWSSNTGTYLRGLAVTSKFFVIGESEQTGRDLRRRSLSGLWILDRKNYRALDFISLGPYGAVNEVRIIDEPDEAHHGYPLINLRNLFKDSALEKIAFCRLKFAKLGESFGLMFKSWKIIFGSINFLPDLKLEAPRDVLCLIIKEGPVPSKLKFAYKLQEECESHVSAIISFAGVDDDSNMICFLLEANGITSNLSIWFNAYGIWKKMSGYEVAGLPIQGTFSLEIHDLEYKILVNDKVILICEKKLFEFYKFSGPSGIRWKAATVSGLQSY